MDYKSIEELIKTVSESKLSFLEIEADGIRVKMEKKVEQVIVGKFEEAAASSVPVLNSNENIKVNYEVQETVVNKENAIPQVQPANSNETIVTSPIVGTVYLAANPTSEPFIKVGSKVKKGEVLCIIEAMKLMNEIESEVDGEIVDILVKGEQMVEYGQPLFRIRA